MSDQQVAQGKNEHPAPLDEAGLAAIRATLRSMTETSPTYEEQANSLAAAINRVNDLQVQLAAAREETAEYHEKAVDVAQLWGNGMISALGYTSSANSLNRLRDLAANPPNGESALKRAAKLEAALGEISHYGLSIPREMTEAQYNRAAMRDMMRIAAAALAETAP